MALSVDRVLEVGLNARFVARCAPREALLWTRVCREWQGRLREFFAATGNNAELEAGVAEGGKLQVENGDVSVVTRAAGFSPAAQARTLQVQTMPSRAE